MQVTSVVVSKEVFVVTYGTCLGIGVVSQTVVYISAYACFIGVQVIPVVTFSTHNTVLSGSTGETLYGHALRRHVKT